MFAAVSVFDWLRAREFKKAMDVEGGGEGGGKRGEKGGYDHSAVET